MIESIKKILRLGKGRIMNHLLVIIIAGVFINLIFSYFATDTGKLHEIKQFSTVYFLIAAIFALIPSFIHAVRLLIWMKFIGSEITLGETFRIILAQELGAAVSPTALGGGPVKAGMLMERGHSIGTSLSLTMLHSIEDAVFFMIAIPLSILLTSSLKIGLFEMLTKKAASLFYWVLIIGAVIALTIIILNIFTSNITSFEKMRQKFKNLLKDFAKIYTFIGQKGKTRFLLNICLAGLQWTIKFSVITALIFSIGYYYDPVQMFLLQWIVFVMMSLIPTPGSIGGAETSFLLIYGSILPAGAIGIILIGWRFLSFYLLNLFAATVLSFIEFNKRKNPPLEKIYEY